MRQLESPDLTAKRKHCPRIYWKDLLEGKHPDSIAAVVPLTCLSLCLFPSCSLSIMISLRSWNGSQVVQCYLGDCCSWRNLG